MRLKRSTWLRLLVFWGGVQNGMNGFEHDATKYAAAVSCPTLLLWGEDDARVSRGEIENVADHLGGEVSLEVVHGVGHQSYCRAKPENYRRSVGAWFAKMKAERALERT